MVEEDSVVKFTSITSRVLLNSFFLQEEAVSVRGGGISAVHLRQFLWVRVCLRAILVLVCPALKNVQCQAP